MAIRLKENSKDISNKSCLLGGPEEKYWPCLADITDQDFTQDCTGVYLCIQDKPPGVAREFACSGDFIY